MHLFEPNSCVEWAKVTVKWLEMSTFYFQTESVPLPPVAAAVAALPSSPRTPPFGQSTFQPCAPDQTTQSHYLTPELQPGERREVCRLEEPVLAAILWCFCIYLPFSFWESVCIWNSFKLKTVFPISCLLSHKLCCCSQSTLLMGLCYKRRAIIMQIF